MEIIELSLESVKPGQLLSNDRQYFDPVSILELAISIARDGLAQPITVRWVEDHYEIVAGERRYRAHCLLRDEGAKVYEGVNEDGTEKYRWIIAPGEVTTIKAIIRDLTNKQASAIMLAENTGRADLNPIEEANAYQSRIDEFQSTPDEIAEMAGVNVDRVRRRLALLTLTEDVQALIKFHHFPIGHAEAMIGLDTNRQRIAMRVYSQARGGLTLARFKHIINDLLQEQQSQSLFDLEAFWVEQVQKGDMPRRGKKAYVPAPTARELPPVQRNTKWTAADIIDQYIADLMAQGFKKEAAALGNVYHTLVRHNYIAVPIHTAIPDQGEQETHEATGQDHRTPTKGGDAGK